MIISRAGAGIEDLRRSYERVLSWSRVTLNINVEEVSRPMLSQIVGEQIGKEIEQRLRSVAL